MFSIEVSGHSLMIAVFCCFFSPPGRPRTSGSNRSGWGEGADGKCKLQKIHSTSLLSVSEFGIPRELKGLPIKICQKTVQ